MVIDEAYPNLDCLLVLADKLDTIKGILLLKWFYVFHPNGLVRKTIVKASLMLNVPIT